MEPHVWEKRPLDLSELEQWAKLPCEKRKKATEKHYGLGFLFFVVHAVFICIKIVYILNQNLFNSR